MKLEEVFAWYKRRHERYNPDHGWQWHGVNGSKLYRAERDGVVFYGTLSRLRDLGCGDGWMIKELRHDDGSK